MGRVLTVLLALLAWSPAHAADKPKPEHVIIGLDVSDSNPLLKSKGFAQKAADRIRPMLETLPPRSVVQLRTLGVYDADANTLRIDRTISATNRPEDVARLVATIIAGVPELVRTGKLKVHPETNILAFLETMGQVSDCAARPTRFVLITDGEEFSKGSAVKLTKLEDKLPVPEKPQFKGCAELQMLGLGLNAKDPKMTTHLRDEWTAWAEAQGFESYVGLFDW